MMRTAMIVVLAVLLALSAAMNLVQWCALRHEADVRRQEVDYAQALAARTFKVFPKDGMVFYKDEYKKEKCEALEFRLGSGGGSHGEPGSLTYGWHCRGISSTAFVDTTELDVSGRAFIYGHTTSAAHHLLIWILGQIRTQDPGWVWFDLGGNAPGTAVGSLVHAAGILTVVVRPFPGHPELQIVEYTSYISSAPARSGASISRDEIPPPQGMQYFRPH